MSCLGHVAMAPFEGLANNRLVAEGTLVACSLLRDDIGVSHPDLRTFVHAGDSGGVVSALAAAVRASRRSWEEHFLRTAVTPDERRMLRCVLQRSLSWVSVWACFTHTCE